MLKQLSFLLLPLLILLFLTTTAFAGVIQLPQTGQTKCYDESGVQISCSGTGQDGEIRAGTPWLKPRFTVGTGTEADCVTDNLTGLMWLKNGDILNNTSTWNAAIDYANDLTLCGYSDWRLPNVNELESLVNAAVSNTATWLNSNGFTNVQSNFYWSSTTYAGSTNKAWIVNMWSGLTYYNDKSHGYYYDHYDVWPVRSEQLNGAFSYSRIWKTGQTISYRPGDDGDLEIGAAWPNPRFIDNEDGTVTDNLTDLVWLKDANCINTNYPEFDWDYPYGDSMVGWQHALDFIKGINNGTYSSCGDGFNDWRLPNGNEIRSLLDYSRYNPALPSRFPFNNVLSNGYWSSTTLAAETGGAWEFDVLDGSIGYNFKLKTYSVWPVRAGQVHIIVTSGPELEVTFLGDPPVSKKHGSSFYVKDTVMNTGVAKAGRFAIRYYLSWDIFKDDNDILLKGSRFITKIKDGKSSKGKTKVTIKKNTPPGKYYLIVCADDNNKVRESNETDNCTASNTMIQVK